MVLNFDSGETFLQICLKADERDVYEFFSRAGKVSSVAILYMSIFLRALHVPFFLQLTTKFWS